MNKERTPEKQMLCPDCNQLITVPLNTLDNTLRCQHWYKKSWHTYSCNGPGCPDWATDDGGSEGGSDRKRQRSWSEGSGARAEQTKTVI